MEVRYMTPEEFDAFLQQLEPEEEPELDWEGEPEGDSKEHLDWENSNTLGSALKGKAIFVPGMDWLYWDGKRWKQDRTHRVERLAMQTLIDHYTALRDSTLDEAAYKQYDRALKRVKRRETITRALTLTEDLLTVNEQELNQDPYLLNFENGTVDLRTGELKPHDPNDYITFLVPYPYDPNAQAPRWEQFLREVFLGDEELIGFVQKAVGYSATGEVCEDKFFLLYGTGANGKTVFLNTIRKALGEYAKSIPRDAVLNRKERGDSHPAVLADLYGVRFGTLSETEEDGKLSEARIKQLTGKDPIKARFMRQDYFEFLPSHKIWLATNHLPTVKDNTEGMWRRIVVIPFRAFFPADKQDPRLEAKLKAEMQGIIRWYVQGARRWYQEGLGETHAVKEITERYRSDMDVIADWLESCCTPDPQAITPFGELYESYRAWCEQVKDTPLSQKAFANRLTAKGYEGIHAILNGAKCRVRKGIRLKS